MVKIFVISSSKLFYSSWSCRFNGRDHTRTETLHKNIFWSRNLWLLTLFLVVVFLEHLKNLFHKINNLLHVFFNILLDCFGRFFWSELLDHIILKTDRFWSRFSFFLQNNSGHPEVAIYWYSISTHFWLIFWFQTNYSPQCSPPALLVWY